MKVCYSEYYNIDLGFLRFLHPFDGVKFRKAYDIVKSERALEFIELSTPVSEEEIDSYLSGMMQRYVKNKIMVMRALEAPNLPFVSFSYIERKVLTPMRWALAGTLKSSLNVLKSGGICWNLSGGYHHATPNHMQGFCIYNDIAYCYSRLIKEGTLTPSDKILIIDVDAHHGNGNAFTFHDNKNVTILDVYNSDIYPNDVYTRKRVDIAVPLPSRSSADLYLEKYSEALNKIEKEYRLVFVIAGTDVLSCDKLGGLNLGINDVVQRDKTTLERLSSMSIPTVVLGGGGYSKESAECIAKSILACATL